MRRHRAAFRRIAFVVLCMAPLLAWAGEDAPDGDALLFVLEIGNRMYPDWDETVRVGMDETFYLGDTEFIARIERFVPDFRIADGGRILSHSDKLDNPAVHVFVYGDSAAADSIWAFQNFPPHFSPRSFFIFRLKAVEGYEIPATPGEAAGKDSAIKKEDGDD